MLLTPQDLAGLPHLLTPAALKTIAAIGLIFCAKEVCLLPVVAMQHWHVNIGMS